ncbi:hypothetical protein K737_300724 [Holospora undulata HU1]|uniref:Uncharacterized protein n=1 Tax=Holospora undulata HU1 TaxID=1321371 RepID=A0A061JG79_9PROT|nr:hypothetical protein K737_300724 [Holospora undulata HU1]
MCLWGGGSEIGSRIFYLENQGSVTAKDSLLFVKAVLYRHRAGISFPERFGDFKAIYHPLYEVEPKGGMEQSI